MAYLALFYSLFWLSLRLVRIPFLMSCLMLVELGFLFEAFVANRANERLVSSVCPEVVKHVALLVEVFVALRECAK